MRDPVIAADGTKTVNSSICRKTSLSPSFFLIVSCTPHRLCVVLCHSMALVVPETSLTQHICTVRSCIAVGSGHRGIQ